MKNTLRIISSLIIGILLINFMAWSSGNTNFYTYEVEENVSPLDVVDPETDRQYFNETVIVETVTPSKFPLIFESKFDTLSIELKSHSR